MRGSYFVYALAVSTFMPSVTFAADALPPPPQIGVPVGLSAEFTGYYLRGDIGTGGSRQAKGSSTFEVSAPGGFRFEQSSVGDSAFGSLGLGYKMNNWMRFDVTGEYRASGGYNAVTSYTEGCQSLTACYSTYRANSSAGVLLANTYVDLGTWSGVTPFVGVGVGGSYNMVKGLSSESISTADGAFGLARDTARWSLAWALTTGLSYAVSPNLQLEVGYRYLNRGASATGPIVCVNVSSADCNVETQKFKSGSHDVRLGMRWMLAEIAAAPGLLSAHAYTPAPEPTPSPVSGKIKLTRK